MLKKVLIACVICCAGMLETRAQAKDYRIYGDVYTVMNTKVSGYIYWGKNLYWTDIFYASKTENPYTRYVDGLSRLSCFYLSFRRYKANPGDRG